MKERDKQRQTNSKAKQDKDRTGETIQEREKTMDRKSIFAADKSSYCNSENDSKKVSNLEIGEK